MKTTVLRRSLSVCLAVLLLCATLPAIAATTKKDDMRKALSDIIIPIEDGPTEYKKPDALQLFAAETINPYEQIHADALWSYETFGNEVNVAVIDTGCMAHRALADTLRKNYYFELPENPTEDSDYIMYETDLSTDTHGHGTHVASIIASSLHNGYVKGIAPKVNLYTFNCYVTDAEGNTGMNLWLALRSLEYAVQVLGCKVINMSFGAPEALQEQEALDFIHEYYTAAYESGAILVASAGNNGDTTRNIPAAFDEVISVGSVNSQNARSSFSVMNDTVDVVAPGGDMAKASVSGSKTEYIYALSLNTDQVAGKCGTSQAAPHVAGAAALLLAARPDLTPAQFKALIRDGSAKIHGEGYDGTDGYGYGLLDVEGMFNELTKNQSCYLAPATNGHISLFNLTDSSITANLFSTSYSALNTLTGCTANTVMIAPGGSSSVPLMTTVNKVFALSPQSLTPLATSRTLPLVS